MVRSALLGGSMLVISSSLAPPRLVPIGPAEVVWNQTSDACPGLNQFGDIGEQPDSMPEAWHNPLTGETSLISATDWGTFATKGPSLNELSHHDCSHRVYKSFNSTDPSDLAGNQWLQSSYMFPDGSGAAMIHSEFHGGMTGDTSLCSVQHNNGNCQYWSTGLAVTSDGGEHWTLARDPPQHYTFAPGRVFHKDSEMTGFGALGGLVFNEDDGYYYGHVNQIRVDPDFSTTSNGVCPFRTNDMFDPRAFRGWDGNAWTTTWVNPYDANLALNGSVSDSHTCAPMKNYFTGHPNMRKFAGDWRPSGWPSHVMLGWPSGKRKLAYAFPAWQPGDVDAFASWDDPQYVDVTEWFDPAIFRAYPLMYPALLDADSPFKLGQGSAAGLSYTLVGNESAFVYFVISRKYIARLPVAWVHAEAPDPTPPFPCQLPGCTLISALLCPQFSVANAGQDDVNGVYIKTEQVVPDSGLPLFQMDSSHHLYQYQNKWKLAHINVGPVYYTVPAGDEKVPSTGWGSGAEPAPTVTCTNPASCIKFQVSGAGRNAVNGIYTRTDTILSNGTPLYQKDSSHQLYFEKTWKLAHYGVGPVYYLSASEDSKAAPVSGWSPINTAPIVTCADATALFV